VLPSALVRLGRARLAVLGLVLNAALAATTVNVGDAAQIRVIGDVNDHWRGSYDILVRPVGAKIDLEKTGGLVEPNFLDYGSVGGISLDQLDEIRRTARVEIAAPISTVGYLQYEASSPTLHVGLFPSEPTLYHLSATASTSDGLGKIVLGSQDARLLLVPGSAARNDKLSASDLADYSSTKAGLDYTFEAVSLSITAPVMAVDPEAEAGLLGDRGAFLQPLAAIQAERAAMASAIPDQFKVAKFFLTGAPQVPMLLSDRLYAPLTLSLRIDRVGHPVSIPPTSEARTARLDAAEAEAGPGTASVATLSFDASSRIVPFLPVSLQFAWPGSAATGDEAYTTKGGGDFVGRIPLPPTLREISPRTGSSAPSFRIAPQAGTGGPVTPYRLFGSYPLALAADALGQQHAFDIVPLGSFDLTSFGGPADPLTYVPYGAYDPPRTSLVAGPDGSAVSERAITPTLDPGGLVSVPPLAITDLQAAVDLRGPAPIDAVRVRVAGLTGFDAESRARVERVASAIAALGLDVDVVAGSSPAPIELYVPGYTFGDGHVADLGWVRQDWTTLGAAQRVETGLTGLNVALLALAIAVAFVVTIGLQNLVLATRVQDIAILRAVGWTPLEVASWYGAEAAIGGLVIAAVGLVGWTVAGRVAPIGLAVALGLAVVAFIVPMVGVLLAWRRASWASVAAGDTKTSGPLVRGLPVRGVATYGLRSALARPLRTLVFVLALSLAGAAVGVGAGEVAATGPRLGPTLLAAAIGGALRPYQLGILALASFGGLFLVLIGYRVDLHARAGELRTLVACGWSHGRVTGLLLVERIVVAAPAGILAAVLAGVGSAAIGDIPIVVAGSVAGVAAGSSLLWSLAVMPGRLASHG
jgi:hypothetical protein